MRDRQRTARLIAAPAERSARPSGQGGKREIQSRAAANDRLDAVDRRAEAAQFRSSGAQSFTAEAGQRSCSALPIGTSPVADDRRGRQRRLGCRRRGNGDQLRSASGDSVVVSWSAGASQGGSIGKVGREERCAGKQE